MLGDQLYYFGLITTVIVIVIVVLMAMKTIQKLLASEWFNG